MDEQKNASALPRHVIGHLSVSSVARAFLAVLFVAGILLLAYLLRETLLLFLLGLFVATIIEPGVRALKRWGVPETPAILLHYVVFLGLATILLVSLIPIIAEQVTALASLSTTQLDSFFAHPAVTLPFLSDETNFRLSSLLRSTLSHLSIQQLPDALQRLGDYLGTLAAGSIQFATGVAGSVVTFVADVIIVLVFAFFLETDRSRIFAWLCQFLPGDYRPYIERKAVLIHRKLAQWAKGQLLLCLVIGLLVFIVLAVLRIPYALTLAILAGFTEFIPYVGPLLAAVPGVLVALAQFGFLWALIIALCYYAIQWCENNLIVPLIMKHAVDISAVATLFAMLVAVSFPTIIHPILGILLAIPVTSIIGIFLDDLRYGNHD